MNYTKLEVELYNALLDTAGDDYCGDLKFACQQINMDINSARGVVSSLIKKGRCYKVDQDELEVPVRNFVHVEVKAPFMDKPETYQWNGESINMPSYVYDLGYDDYIELFRINQDSEIL